MTRTTVTLEGNLAEDPQVRFTPSGKQITDITVLLSAGRTATGARVEAEPTRHVVRAFKTLVENILESLAKGSGLRARDCDERGLDRQADREKRTAQRVLAEVVGPSLRWATARITTTTRIQVGDQTPDDMPGQEAQPRGEGCS